MMDFSKIKKPENKRLLKKQAVDKKENRSVTITLRVKPSQKLKAQTRADDEGLPLALMLVRGLKSIDYL